MIGQAVFGLNRSIPSFTRAYCNGGCISAQGLFPDVGTGPIREGMFSPPRPAKPTVNLATDRRNQFGRWALCFHCYLLSGAGRATVGHPPASFRSRSTAERGETQRQVGRGEGAASIQPMTGTVRALFVQVARAMGPTRKVPSADPVGCLCRRAASPVREPRVLPQPRLLVLDTLGEGGCLKTIRLARCAPRNPRRPEELQQALFAHHEAWGWLLGLPDPANFGCTAF